MAGTERVPKIPGAHHSAARPVAFEHRAARGANAEVGLVRAGRRQPGDGDEALVRQQRPAGDLHAGRRGRRRVSVAVRASCGRADASAQRQHGRRTERFR